MEIKPLTHYKAPKYPMQSETKENDSLVNEVCHKWNHKMAKTSLMAATAVMALSGCAQAQTQQMNVQDQIAFQGQTVITQQNVVTFDSSEEAMQLRSERRMIEDGTLMLTPIAMPQFYRLSEEEAWKIIDQKAKEVGLNLVRETEPIKLTEIDQKEYIEHIKNIAPKQDVKKLNKALSFKIDGYDPDKKVGIEFINPTFDLGKKNLNSEELMSVYDITDAVNNALAQKYPDKNIKIFKIRADFPKAFVEEETSEGVGTVENTSQKVLEAALDKFFDELREKGIIK